MPSSSKNPGVVVINNFLNDNECSVLINHIEKFLWLYLNT